MLHKPRYEDASHLTVDWKQLVSFGSLLIRVVYAACGIPSRCHNICFALLECMYPIVGIIFKGVQVGVLLHRTMDFFKDLTALILFFHRPNECAKMLLSVFSSICRDGAC